jgi:hypothetical protein
MVWLANAAPTTEESPRNRPGGKTLVGFVVADAAGKEVAVEEAVAVAWKATMPPSVGPIRVFAL